MPSNSFLSRITWGLACNAGLPTSTRSPGWAGLRALCLCPPPASPGTAVPEAASRREVPEKVPAWLFPAAAVRHPKAARRRQDEPCLVWRDLHAGSIRVLSRRKMHCQGSLKASFNHGFWQQSWAGRTSATRHVGPGRHSFLSCVSGALPASRRGGSGLRPGILPFPQAASPGRGFETWEATCPFFMQLQRHQRPRAQMRHHEGEKKEQRDVEVSNCHLQSLPSAARRGRDSPSLPPPGRLGAARGSVGMWRGPLGRMRPTSWAGSCACCRALLGACLGPLLIGKVTWINALASLRLARSLQHPRSAAPLRARCPGAEHAGAGC